MKKNSPLKKSGKKISPDKNQSLTPQEAQVAQNDNGKEKISEYTEKKFQSAMEFDKSVLNDSKKIFGEQTFLISAEKIPNEFWDNFIPHSFLLEFSDVQKPRFYLVETAFSKSTPLGEMLLRITSFFGLLKNQDKIEKLCEEIGKDKGLKKELKDKINGSEVAEFLKGVISKPFILLVIDSYKQELERFMETYSEWQKVKPLFIRKFGKNGDTIYTTNPDFAGIYGKGKSKAEQVRQSEEDHLQNVSEIVKENFLRIKSELLKADKEIEFRVKKYYISLRKKHNLAFFQLGKKKLSIVIANPEKNTRKQVKHHHTLTLADSVKKFWNGNEHCFTVVIESREHLGEIVNALKKLVARPA